ncbi:MRC1 protein, partial [Amia calva]|nr:MRC1 protein [Amia calva]
KKYYYVATPLSWTNAQSYCRQKYTDLSTVDNQTDQYQLLTLIQKSAWIGMYHDQPNWQWSSREDVTFYNWKKNWFCAKFNAEGTWEDDVCHQTYFFMCYTNNVTQRYTLITQNENWATARDYCREHHTDLVTIRSPRENEAVKERGQGSIFWIGLFNEPWKWSNGRESLFRNWAPANPSNVNRSQACVLMEPTLGNMWSDASCSITTGLICCDKTSNISQRYTLISESKNWAAARDYCREKHTDLVTIQNDSENKAVMERAEGSVVWIGLFNEPWSWSSGGKSSFRYWRVGEPDNFLTNERCIMLNADSTWNDYPCQETLAFFCEDDVRELVLVRENKTWEEALDHCRAHYTDLTSIVSEKEHNLTALTAADAQTPHVWLGLRQSFITHSWFWVNREALGYQKWVQGGQPQCPQSSYCGAMSNTTEGHAWTDRHCEEKLNFICYRGRSVTLISVNTQDATEGCSHALRAGS